MARRHRSFRRHPGRRSRQNLPERKTQGRCSPLRWFAQLRHRGKCRCAPLERRSADPDRSPARPPHSSLDGHNAHEAECLAPFVDVAHRRLLQRRNGAADLVEALDVPVERMALGLRDPLVGQMIAEIGAPGRAQGVVVALDVLGRALHELDLLAVVEAGDAARGPDQVIGGGRHPVLALEAELKVVVRAHVVVLQEGDELGRVAVDPVHARICAGAAVSALADGVAKGREEPEVEHREARVAARVGIARSRGPRRVYHQGRI